MFVPYLEQHKTLTPEDEKLYAEIMATESDWFVPVEEEKQTPHYTVELTSDAFADPFIIRDNTVPYGEDGRITMWTAFIRPLKPRKKHRNMPTP